VVPWFEFLSFFFPKKKKSSDERMAGAKMQQQGPEMQYRATFAKI
jgi:hypothetical protein